MEKTLDLSKELIFSNTYKAKKKRNFDKKPLWNKDGIIDKDIGFELTFGFRDIEDVNLYSSNSSLDIVSIPKNDIEGDIY